MRMRMRTRRIQRPVVSRRTREENIPCHALPVASTIYGHGRFKATLTKRNRSLASRTYGVTARDMPPHHSSSRGWTSAPIHARTRSGRGGCPARIRTSHMFGFLAAERRRRRCRCRGTLLAGRLYLRWGASSEMIIFGRVVARDHRVLLAPDSSQEREIEGPGNWIREGRCPDLFGLAAGVAA